MTGHRILSDQQLMCVIWPLDSFRRLNGFDPLTHTWRIWSWRGETAACVAWGAFLHSKRVDLLLYTLVN
jgi:hypothetical protein